MSDIKSLSIKNHNHNLKKILYQHQRLEDWHELSPVLTHNNSCFTNVFPKKTHCSCHIIPTLTLMIQSLSAFLPLISTSNQTEPIVPYFWLFKAHIKWFVFSKGPAMSRLWVSMSLWPMAHGSYCQFDWAITSLQCWHKTFVTNYSRVKLRCRQ